jgi:2-keto-4-pentenoate hydratase/2-oxohepta-3-ene-1,7-dioic acid hydratase in catechol pathway
VKLGRISVDGPDGPTARLVRVLPEEGRVVDLARAEALRLQARHAEPDTARLLARASFPSSMTVAISLGEHFLEAAEQATSRADDASFAINDVRWLPAADPTVLRDGLTFVGHIRGFFEKNNLEPKPEMLRIPGYAKLSPATVIGHDDEVYFPHKIDTMDYELELGYVVGRRGKDLDPESAMQHIFGLTLFNDFSGRNLQRDEMAIGMGAAKSKDFATSLGPWITTIDEFADLSAIPLEVRVNGETWAKGDSSGRLWSVGELLAYVSLGEYILPGDVIGSGTMGGGSALELDRKLEPGDVVELEAGGIGVLRNRMGPRAEETWWPEARDGAALGW